MLGGLAVAMAVASQMPFLQGVFEDRRRAWGIVGAAGDGVPPRRRRRHLGPRLDHQARRAGPWPPGSSRGRACSSTAAVRRGLLVGSSRLSLVVDRARGRRRDERGELRRRARRARGGHHRHRRHRLLRLHLPALARGEPDRRTPTWRPWSSRRWSARASASCRTTSTRPASSWATRAPCSSASSSRPRRSSSPGRSTPRRVIDRQTVPAFLPILLPIAVLAPAAARHGARGRPPGRRRTLAVPPGPAAPAPPAAPARPLPPAGGRHHVRVDRGVRLRRRRPRPVSTTTVLSGLGVATVVAALLTLGPLRGRARPVPDLADHPEGKRP